MYWAIERINAYRRLWIRETYIHDSSIQQTCQRRHNFNLEEYMSFSILHNFHISGVLNVYNEIISIYDFYGLMKEVRQSLILGDL